MNWTGPLLALAGFGLFLAGYLCRMVDEQAGRDTAQPGAPTESTMPLHIRQAEEAVETALQVRSQWHANE